MANQIKTNYLYENIVENDKVSNLDIEDAVKLILEAYSKIKVKVPDNAENVRYYLEVDRVCAHYTENKKQFDEKALEENVSQAIVWTNAQREKDDAIEEKFQEQIDMAQEEVEKIREFKVN